MPKDKVTLEEAQESLRELMAKLSGPSGRDWLVELGHFLRKEATWGQAPSHPRPSGAWVTGGLNIPDEGWELLLRTVLKNPHQVRLVEAIRRIDRPVHRDELPFQRDFGDQNPGATEVAINVRLKNAGVPYRMKGYQTRKAIVSINRLSLQHVRIRKPKPAAQESAQP